MNVLIVGGSGYIGSHLTKSLMLDGHSVTIYDYKNPPIIPTEFWSGHEWKIIELLEFDVVVYLGGYIEVAESQRNPMKYYKNNVADFIEFLDTCPKNIPFIFASSAAVYDPAGRSFIEDSPIRPLSVYGRTKWMCEQILSDTMNNHISLRFFNVSGADGAIGENHEPESHLIPLAIQAAMEDREFAIFGADYATPDGTCVRDYIHVQDVVNGIMCSMEALVNKRNSAHVYNLGNGKGYTNLQIMREIQKHFPEFKFSVADRRPGDPAMLVAESAAIQKDLGWKPVYNLDDIVKSAIMWERQRRRIS